MPKIAFLADLNSVHIQRYADYFKSKGWDVVGIDYKEGNANWKYEKIQLPYSNTKLFFLNKNKLKEVLNKIKSDVVSAHYVTTYGFLGALSKYKPLVVSAIGSDILVNPNNPLLRMFVKKSLKAADKVLVDGLFTKNILKELGRTEDVEVVYYGVDINKFNPEVENKRKELNLENNYVVGSFRNFYDIYSIETLIKAAPLVIKEILNAKFLIVGGGPLKNKIEQLAKDLNIYDKIIFTGYVEHDKLPPYIKTCNVYISTSLSDTTSVSLLEALAVGLPCVVTEIEGNKEWVNGKNGLFFKTRDHNELANQIIKISKAKLNNVSQLNFNLIKEKAEWSKNMEKAEQIMLSLIKK
ncbi:MAG: glycosyltransferase [Candidatus Woesearchaeota archaeon]|nr:MAG: glycosyltransferase [Candidatus Woesearchaeota archaeon]